MTQQILEMKPNCDFYIYIMVKAASECTCDGGGGVKTYARLHWKSNNFLSKNIPSVTSTASRSES